MEKKLPRDSIIAVAIMIAGGFITILNQTVIGPALPDIMNEFHITASEGQWLSSIYVLLNGLMIPLSAYLIDRFTTRQVYMTSLVVFALGTFLGSLAPGFAQLLAGRAIQAAAAGVQLTLGSVLVMRIFPLERRGFGFGVYSIVISSAPAIGPTVSGWLVDAFGWRSVFYTITPFVVVLMIVALVTLRNVGETLKTTFDAPSFLLAVVAFGGLLYGFTEAGNAGGILSPRAIVPIIIGAVCLVVFARRQLRLKEPLLHIETLKTRRFAISIVIITLLGAGMFSVSAVILPLFLIDIQGKNALIVGLIMIPGATLQAISNPFVGKLFDRFGPRHLSICGTGILFAGAVVMAFLQSGAPLMHTVIGYTLYMWGIAFVFMPITIWGVNSLPDSFIAHGNAIGNTARLVGSAIGIPLFVSIMTIVSSKSGVAAGDVAIEGINAAFAGIAILYLVTLIVIIATVRNTKNKGG
ncbi:MAG: DHA2 family efflux MFS transporter permease subunit [Clostridiales Family XIII bacterium]|jgi:EmrB/QacA subfamily drug resistance transporter|nr:DHA2 family efflux MFS transporter permease subunit [Clostridiales Family XIII bacterium]